MSDNKRLLSLCGGYTPFTENFSTSYTPPANNVWYDIYNNWDWFSYRKALITVSRVYCNTYGTGYNKSY